MTGSMDESVRIWTVKDTGLETEGPLQGHMLGVISVAVDSTGKYGKLLL